MFNDTIMEAALRTLQVTLPVADARFLRRLSGNMGWKVSTKKTSRRLSSVPSYYDSEQFLKDLDAAEQDIASGKGKTVRSKQELDALFV